MPGVAGSAGIQGILVVEILALQIHRAEQGIVERLLVEIRVLGLVVGQVHLVLEEDQAAAGAGLAVGVVAQRVVRAESLGGLAAADAAGDVVLLVDDVVPERRDGALVIEIVGLGGDVGHARVAVDGPHGVADGLILLDDRHVALVVFAAVLAAVEQELGQLGCSCRPCRLPSMSFTKRPNRTRACSISWWPSYHSFLGAGPMLADPAIGQLLGRVIQPGVLPSVSSVVVDGRFEEIAGDVAFCSPRRSQCLNGPGLTCPSRRSAAG